MPDIQKILDTAIQDLETKLASLRAARSALGGHASGKRVRKRGRRMFSTEQRAEISRRMKARWAKIRAEKGSAKK